MAPRRANAKERAVKRLADRLFKSKKFYVELSIARVGSTVFISTTNEETAREYLHAFERTTLDASRMEHQLRMLGEGVQVEHLKDSMQKIIEDLNELRMEKELARFNHVGNTEKTTPPKDSQKYIEGAPQQPMNVGKRDPKELITDKERGILDEVKAKTKVKKK